MKPYKLLPLLLAALPGAVLADTSTLTPIADTYTRTGVGAGTAVNLDVRGFGGGDFVAYIKFDLSSLPIDSITGATFTLHETAGSRNDGITTGRFQNFGLTTAAGNTPQNWDEATLIDTTVNAGAEYTNTGGDGVDLAQVFNLDAEGGANVTESVPGTDGVPVSITGPDLVTFLNQRVADGGLVTFINTIDANDRGYGFASRENADSGLWPSLELTYTAVPEPSAFALFGLGVAGLLVWRRVGNR